MSIVLNSEKEKELNRLGYTILGNLDSEVFSEFKKVSLDFIEKTKKKYPKGELFNLINSDLEIKLVSNAIVAKYLNPFVETKLNTEAVDIYPVSHLVKPFGLNSDIWHQDSAVVDERKDFSLNVWVPFVDVNRLNGCLWILPGSHISINFARQFGYNPIEGEALRTFKKHMISIKVKAGEVLIFYRNLIHGSSRNWLPVSRIAAESVVVSKNAQFYNFHREDSIAKNKVLGYQVQMEHFLKENPKEDFYTGKYPYIEFDDEGFENIQNYLVKSIPAFLNHSRGN
ncbi:MAG: phytanoyl-CoA dioxygenase family protein [Bacteroidia bacterium]